METEGSYHVHNRMPPNPMHPNKSNAHPQILLPENLFLYYLSTYAQAFRVLCPSDFPQKPCIWTYPPHMPHVPPLSSSQITFPDNNWLKSTVNRGPYFKIILSLLFLPSFHLNPNIFCSTLFL